MDKTRYVTRSVANHLNDISKIDAPFVIETLKRWKHSNGQDEKEMQFIMTHALRGLVKNGNKEALSLLGYNPNSSVELMNFMLKSSQIKVGESLAFSFVLKAKSKENLMIDYLIYFQSKSGKTLEKVYKLKKIMLYKDEKINLIKEHRFKENMTTRTFYRGEHQIALQINGKIYEERPFILEL
jgi:hypothetical protein